MIEDNEDKIQISIHITDMIFETLKQAKSEWRCDCVPETTLVEMEVESTRVNPDKAEVIIKFDLEHKENCLSHKFSVSGSN